MLTLLQQTLCRLENEFTVGLVETVVVVPKLLLESLFVLFGHILHVFFVQQWNLLVEDVDDVPHV